MPTWESPTLNSQLSLDIWEVHWQVQVLLLLWLNKPSLLLKQSEETSSLSPDLYSTQTNITTAVQLLFLLSLPHSIVNQIFNFFELSWDLVYILIQLLQHIFYKKRVTYLSIYYSLLSFSLQELITEKKK